MPVGYDMPAPTDGAGFDALRDGFEWQVPETYNIADVVADATEPAAAALVHTDDAGAVHEFSYAELDEAAAVLASHLADEGVDGGDRVGLCLPQSPELLVAHLAVYRLGAITVPLSVILGRDSFGHSLAHSDASALILDGQARERFGETLDDHGLAVELVVDLDGTTDSGGPDTGAAGVAYAGEHRALGGLREILDADSAADQRAEAPPVARTAPDDTALIVYTSGTTGDPKGVAQSHQYLIGSLPGYQCWFHLFEEPHGERVWTPAEWAWAGALFDVVFPTLATGGTVVSAVRRSGFDPNRGLDLLADRGVSRVFLPPTAVWQFQEHTDPERADLSALEVLMCGGESLSPELFEWAEDAFDATVNETYGQTEANALVGNCQAAFPAEPGSMGKPYPGHDVAVVDPEDGEPVAPGETGEIVLEAPDPVLFEGYWDDPAATEAVFDGDRYWTSDLATVDEDGYVSYRGRADDLIVSAGYRVNPTEVEDAMRRSPAVSAVVVGGVPDEERGQRVAAYVVPADGVEPDDALSAELRDLVADVAGRHKVPRDITYIQSPPETRSGKIDRSALFDRD